MQRILIGVYNKLFNRYAIAYLGNINDCCIAKYNLDSIAMVMLGSSSNEKHAQLDESCSNLEELLLFKTKRFEDFQR